MGKISNVFPEEPDILKEVKIKESDHNKVIESKGQKNISKD
jgi:hypothetical protein